MLNYALYNQAQYGQGAQTASMGNGLAQTQNQLGQLSPSSLGVAANFAQLQNQSNQLYGMNNFTQDPRLRMMQVSFIFSSPNS